MKLLEEQLRYSATDVANFLLCRYLTELDLAAEHGLVKRPRLKDLATEALARRGEQHEARLLDEFSRSGWEIADMSKGGIDFLDRASRTEASLSKGVDVIYQGALLRGRRLGLPDFLVRADLLGGEDGFEVVDAKLARSAKAQAVLQSAFYSQLLAETIAIEPVHMHLALGNTEWASFRVNDYAAYARQIREMFERLLEIRPAFPPTDMYPEPVEHCAICKWRQECIGRRRRDDDLSLVASMTSRQRKGLKTLGISTRREFAALEELPVVSHVGKEGLEKAQEQARLQVLGEDRAEHVWQFVEPERTEDGALRANRGLLALPEPAEGDLFFDIEGARYYSEDGQEFGLQYLFGLVDTAEINEEGQPRYHALWAFDRSQEKEAFKRVVDYLFERLSTRPAAHVYHYNHYEPTALEHLSELHQAREDILRQLMGRFATREDELDDLLRRRVFVDLYRIVRQGIQASVESYSIKKLEPLYDFQRRVDLADVNAKSIEFEIDLDEGEAAEDELGRRLMQGYNEDDCRSTLELRSWLEQRRADLNDLLGTPLRRPVPEEPQEIRVDPTLSELREALLADLPEEGDRSAPQAARELMANLLEFHRRDVKPQWWRYFHLTELSDAELLEEADAIAGISFVGTGALVKKSTLYAYRYPPQEHGFRDGDSVEDPHTGKGWTIHQIDDATGTFSIARGPSRLDEPHPTSLIEPKPTYRKTTHAESLRELGRDVLAAGDAEWSHSPALDLLLRRRPNVPGEQEEALRSPDEESVEAGRRLALQVDSSYLPVQGPPGTGKTYTASRQVIDLVLAGKKVGVTANSHAVICNLLDEIANVATLEGTVVRIGQKPGEDGRWVNRAAADSQLLFRKNADVRSALDASAVDVVGGTSWVWTHPDMERTLDFLVVDEAGQLSLADALAAARSARCLILLGDPMQLTQPSQGAHPPGADVSALKHVLGDQKTMPLELGLFIERTRRMHPSIYGFTSEVFYEDRLLGIEGLERQEILGGGGFTGAGFRWIDVQHEGNGNASPEEAIEVAKAVKDVVGRSWRDKAGNEQMLGLDDVLIMTPFNAQIREIEEALEALDAPRVMVGTVDKFQGRQAPVVVYSMASSSGEEAPRGMEFLYDLHRLNVATSRAQALVIVVASPMLVQVFGRTPRQLLLANALCRLRELAL
jgi:uncharacterized protein